MPPSAAPPPGAGSRPMASPQFASLMAPFQSAWDRSLAHDASHRHPVFFTEKLRRPPFAVASAPQSSPIAHGYVYQESTRANDKGAGPRL